MFRLFKKKLKITKYPLSPSPQSPAPVLRPARRRVRSHAGAEPQRLLRRQRLPYAPRAVEEGKTRQHTDELATHWLGFSIQFLKHFFFISDE